MRTPIFLHLATNSISKPKPDDSMIMFLHDFRPCRFVPRLDIGDIKIRQDVVDEREKLIRQVMPVVEDSTRAMDEKARTEANIRHIPPDRCN